MDKLKLFKAVMHGVDEARAAGMSSKEIASVFYFALECLSAGETERGPGFLLALDWLNTQRDEYLDRLASRRS